MQSETISVKITFLEPYRMVNWSEGDRRIIRGQNYARRKADQYQGLPFLTGTLVRSTVIKAAEELLSLNNGTWNDAKCCPGEFLTVGEKKPAFRRKRYTLQWGNAPLCNEENRCPYCILLGRHDTAGKDHKNNNNAWGENDYDIHFSNFSPLPEYRKNGLRLKDFTIERTLNRVDFESGKAQDYFRIYEVDHEILPEYRGKITLNKPCANAKRLLLDSLRFIDKLCGALCTIEIMEKAPPASSGKDQADVQESREDAVPQNDPATPLKEWAKTMAAAFTGADKQEKLRTFADAVRSLRFYGQDIIDKLPCGREDRDKGHHLWDIEVQKSPQITVRSLLKNLWEEYKVKDDDWRRFTESLGNHLYLACKEASGGVPVRYRILGEAEYYPDTPEKVTDTFIPATPPANNEIKEWIITGRLKAVTPFYFGSIGPAQSVIPFDGVYTECANVLGVAEGVVLDEGKRAQSQKDEAVLDTSLTVNDHTSFRILLDRKNRYRIPRSVLRGVLRRDLRIAFGTGCNVELGGQFPCNCKVCTEMRRITLRDSVTEFSEPPEIRYRIRKDPCYGTVEEGSLFDMEAGPEGVTFPFVLRYRGIRFPEELASVIRYWQEDEMAWLGGFGSIGKGRFALVDVTAIKWTLKEKGLALYINKKGLRGEESDLQKEDVLSPDYLTDFGTSLTALASHESYRDNLKPLWTEVSYTIEVNSPLLTADTIAALTDSRNTDAIAYRKRVYVDGKTEPEKRFAVKAETHRGIFRTAIGRRAGDDDLVKDSHEDCTGVLCSIFGNEHEAGNIRFDDLVVVNEDISEKHMDHVAIDRFNGGAVDRKKFDALPLAGSPGKPLRLKGKLWIKQGLSDEYKKKIAVALSDIRDGLYPLGSRGGAGYGWVTKLCLDNVPEEIKNALRKSIPHTTVPPPPAYDKFTLMEKCKWNPKHYYFPYIFLQPHSTVKREKKVIGHEKFHDDLISGKLVCTLETLTPLIIPNTGEAGENTGDEHKRYDFFSINGETMIPGSEIRGVISSVYEAFTNSCLRIFEEERYISRRPKAGEEDVIPGIVKEENGNFKVIKTWETIKEKKKDEELYFYRLPLYDDENITTAIPFDETKEKDVTRKKKINAAMKWNEEIAKVAKKNQDYLNLNGLSDEERNAILYGKKMVNFLLEENERNPNDHLAYFVSDDPGNPKIKKGYVKFTGLNTVQINKNSTLEFEKEEYLNFLKEFFNGVKSSGIEVKEKGDKVYIDLSNTPEEIIKEIEGVFASIINDDIFSLETQHNTYGWRPSQKKKYPRPRLWFIKDSVQYTIPKRCERVFLASSNRNTFTKEYNIPDKVRRQYNSIMEDYKKNFDHIEEKFRTIKQSEKLSDGDLVYFIPDKNNTSAAAVFPVPLSRKADEKTLGERLPYPDLSPCVKDGAANIDTEELPLCPACRLFGSTFYKGRVRFGIARHENKPKWYKENEIDGGFLTLPFLSSPRATWPLPENKSKIPGRKFYFHHHGWKDIKDEKQTKNNCSVKALDKGNRFSFEIYFENLHPWELGILLYSLELERANNLAHKMGKAKAFGFGSVRITVENVLEMDKNGEWTNSNQKKNVWLDAGFAKMENWFCSGNQKWHEIEHVKNLRTILRFSEENEQTGKHIYPKLKQEEESLPGYMELKDTLKNCTLETVKEFFTVPGFQWHPFPEVTPIQKAVRKDEERAHGKEKRIAKKHTGVVASIDHKRELITIVKDNGRDTIQGKTKDVNLPYKLDKGKKIQFTIAEGLIPLARNIEIID